MATTDTQLSAEGRTYGFRQLIRISIAVQVVVLSVVVAVGLISAFQTTALSERLRDASANVLLMQGATQEFERSRASLRRYVDSGEPFALGPFTQSRQQINTIGLTLIGNLDGVEKTLATRYVASIQRYLEEVGEVAVEERRTGSRSEAAAVLTAPESLGILNQINEQGAMLQSLLADEQAEASNAVRDRQLINVALIVLAALVMLGCGLGVLLWIRRRMLVPLENLAVASRNLGRGDLSTRVDPRGVEEIALTGAAFNQMADEIEQHVGRLHDLSVARSRFVSSVSHELRTPITAMRGYLDLLEQGEAGELTEDQEKYVKIAGRNARELDELITDLLTMSRVQSGKLEVQKKPVNLHRLLTDLTVEMKPIGADRGVDVVLVDTGELIVSGDALRLKQAFGNLLSNSIKYSHEGQAVVVRAFAANRQAVVSFVDWGVGIPREDLPKIAEPFFRAGDSENVPGTGLGLAIAKQMVELNGGRLAVESELGSGSTFTVYLPLQGVRLPEEEAPAEAVR